MVSPIFAWTITLIAIVVTAMLWLVSAPIVSALFSSTSGLLPEEASGAVLTMRLEFITIPIIICIGFIVWAYLVTTRRQLVTRPGAWS